MTFEQSEERARGEELESPAPTAFLWRERPQDPPATVYAVRVADRLENVRCEGNTDVMAQPGDLVLEPPNSVGCARVVTLEELHRRYEVDSLAQPEEAAAAGTAGGTDAFANFTTATLPGNEIKDTVVADDAPKQEATEDGSTGEGGQGGSGDGAAAAGDVGADTGTVAGD